MFIIKAQPQNLFGPGPTIVVHEERSLGEVFLTFTKQRDHDPESKYGVKLFDSQDDAQKVVGELSDKLKYHKVHAAGGAVQRGFNTVAVTPTKYLPHLNYLAESLGSLLRDLDNSNVRLLAAIAESIKKSIDHGGRTRASFNEVNVDHALQEFMHTLPAELVITIEKYVEPTDTTFTIQL